MSAYAELANRIRKLEDAVRQHQTALRAAFDAIDALHRDMEMYRNRRPLRVVNSDELQPA